MAQWKCPECGFIKNVICPVCGADKEPGAICSACGQEYSHTGCPECGSSEWHEEPLEEQSYEEKLIDILRLREGRYITYYELMRLTAMFAPESLKRICENDPIDVKNLSQKAFSQAGEQAIEALTEIDGVEKGLARSIIKIIEDNL